MADLMKSLQMASTVLQTVAPIASGVAQRREGDASARQYEIAAGQSRAAGQRAASEERRKARLVQSRVQALAGASDPGVVNLMADIAGEGEYRALSALYEGDDRASGFDGAASAARYRGKQAQTAGLIGGASSFLDTTPELMKKYGGFKGYGGRY